MDRRDFFRKLLLRGLDRAEKAGDNLGKRYKAIEDHLTQAPGQSAGQSAGQNTHKDSSRQNDNAPTHFAPVGRFLRPPGSGTEAQFTSQCKDCGLCAQACPADAILIETNQAAGKPYILPRATPCVMCNDVSCTVACPSGALTAIKLPADIHIGVARIDHARCLRSPAATVSRGGSLHGEDCMVCVSQCPVGKTALAINDDDELEVRDACTGCGVCERACPTEPTSIWIVPKSQMDD